MTEEPLRCSGFPTFRYHSKDHQKINWKMHKFNFQSYRLERSLITGLHFVTGMLNQLN